LQRATRQRYFTDVRSVTIIGAGRVGGAIALALDRVGYRVDMVVYRGDRYLDRLQASLPRTTRFQPEADLRSIDSEILIIASGDPEIRGIAKLVSGLKALPEFALHTSGSLSSAELSPLAETGVRTASLHPLAAVSDPLTGPDRFLGAYFCVEGDAAAAKIAETIAEEIGGKPFSIPTEFKSLYHAAAVMSAGHVVALLDAAIELMIGCGLSPDDAQRVLLPLASGSIANLADRRPLAALTGPYARGDETALARHLEAFSAAGSATDLREIYLDLAARSVEMSIREGREMERLRSLIQIAKATPE
jgi:predicted short-subunit dehydrogenase-like oxidoreductase (DUF2520 family)